MAKSGLIGNASILGYANTPITAVYLGVTGIIGPEKPPDSRFFMIALPARLLPLDAPMTATEVGLKSALMLR
jgi:hypothetical protein